MSIRTSDAGWPIHIISLVSDTQRRQQIEASLNSLQLTYSFFDAVDGRRGLPPEFEPCVDRPAGERRMGRALSDGEWSCALSHRQVYRHICEHGLEGAVILEDDAQVGQAFKDFCLNAGYLKGDLIQLDHMDGRRWLWTRAQAVSPNVIGYRLARNAHLTSGYSISRRAAEYLYDQGQPLRGLADWPLDLAPLRPLALAPKPVMHPETTSLTSWLEEERAQLQKKARAQRRLSRLLTAAYWQRKAFKLATCPVV